MASRIVRLILQNQSQFLALSRKSIISNRLLSRTCLRCNSVASSSNPTVSSSNPTVSSSNPIASSSLGSESSYTVPRTSTTGWDKARYPQEELLEMHRRAARNEEPRLERRRRLHFVKLVIAIGASFVAPLSLITAILVLGRHDITYHGIW